MKTAAELKYLALALREGDSEAAFILHQRRAGLASARARAASGYAELAKGRERRWQNCRARRVRERMDKLCRPYRESTRDDL